MDVMTILLVSIAISSHFANESMAVLSRIFSEMSKTVGSNFSK